jgi:hypothetical protein
MLQSGRWGFSGNCDFQIVIGLMRKAVLDLTLAFTAIQHVGFFR